MTVSIELYCTTKCSAMMTETWNGKDLNTKLRRMARIRKSMLSVSCCCWMESWTEVEVVEEEEKEELNLDEEGFGVEVEVEEVEDVEAEEREAVLEVINVFNWEDLRIWKSDKEEARRDREEEIKPEDGSSKVSIVCIVSP